MLIGCMYSNCHIYLLIEELNYDKFESKVNNKTCHYKTEIGSSSVPFMYLEKQQKNKHTIGKQLRKIKHLRMSDPSAKLIPMPPELQEYYDQLVGKGLQVRNLKFALFETSNGLKYPGLIATQKIIANTVLVKLPVDQLLTTRDAFLSDVQKQFSSRYRIFVQNPAFFAKRFTSDWEDRIILTFLLYQYQKGKNSKWYNLIRNLPRDIDYAIFWNKEEIDFLEDEYLSRHIQSQKQKFEQESTQLLKILKNYPQFFSPQTLTLGNITWLHTHLVTRCFGKYFEYTTMVPFAQLFNHECVDVYYTMYYKPGNPHDEKEEFYEEKEITQKQMEEGESSDGSYDAEDWQDDVELITEEYNNKDKDKDKEQVYWQVDADKYGPDNAKDIKSILYHMFTFINFSDSVSLNYVSQILQQLADTINLNSWQARKKKCQQIHTLNVLYIRKVKQFYKKIKRKYYTYAITQRQKPSSPKPVDLPEEGVNYFEKDWPKDKFDEFYMLCSTKDQFQKNSQVFFCYGRLPNKLLLMRYGIALQHNKYDHMFVKIDVEKDIRNNKYLRTVCREIQIRKYLRFKIKRTKMCVELIAYFRMQWWKYGGSLDAVFGIVSQDLQLKVLAETKQFYAMLLTKYKANLHKNQSQLSNKALGYHKYFALVYKTQQQRMITQQIKMIDYASEVLTRVKKGESLKAVLSKEENHEKLTYQIMMEVYFRMMENVEVL